MTQHEQEPLYQAKRSSIRTKLQGVFILLIFVSTVLIAIAALRSIKQSYDVINDILPVALEERFKATVHHEVEIMVGVLKGFFPTPNTQVTPQILQDIRNIIHRTKYSIGGVEDDGYFFMYDLQGNVVAHGLDPSLEGKNLNNLKDLEGNLIIPSLQKAALQGGGFVTYWWNKPSDIAGKYKKLSFAEMIPNSNYWIGTGIYIDEINLVMKRLIDHQNKVLYLLFLKFLFLTLTLIVLAIIISLYFGARVANPIITLSRSAKRIASGDYKTRAPVHADDELGDMAKSFNDMADSINDKIKALEKKEHYTTHLLESIGDGLIVTDQSDKIVQINPAILNILGYSKEELIGKNIKEFIPDIIQQEYKENIQQNILRGKTYTINDVVFNKKDKSELHLNVTIAPVIEDDNRIQFRIHSVKDMTEEVSLRKQVKQMEHLKKYFPEQVAEQVIDENGDINLGYDRKKVTIFFSDLVNFTDLSDSMEPEEIINILKEYFSTMSIIVHKYGGTLDKFIGDAVMVFFGAPTTKGVIEDAKNCINMALEMQKKLSELNHHWKLANELVMRIGINTGYVTVGNIGSETRLEYTIIGTPVNIASRLEHDCTPGKILISFDTAQLVQEEFSLSEKEAVQLKGIHRLIKTYEVLGKKS